MCDFTDEEKYLADLDYSRSLYYISQNVFEIGRLLTCSICFEILNKPTTLINCIHMFCKDCIETYLECSNTKEPPCPICQEPIKKNCLRLNKCLENYIIVLNSIWKHLHINRVSKPTSLQLLLRDQERSSQNKQNNTFRSNNNKNVLFDELRNSHMLKAKKIIYSNNEVISAENGLRSLRTINILAKPLWDNPAEQSNHLEIEEPQSQNIVVLPVPIGNGKTNSSLPWIQSEMILNKNECTKANVDYWLQNVENDFNQIPHTQENQVPILESPELNIPSVSQTFVHQKNRKQTLKSHNHIQQSRVPPKCDISTKKMIKNILDKRRARSLESCCKKISSNFKQKRHSIAAGENSNYNVIIDNFSSEEDIGNKKIEQTADESVSVILENKLVNKGKSGSLKKEFTTSSFNMPLRNTRLSAQSSKLPEIIEQTNKRLIKESGWARIKQIKKDIRKVERKPTKLSVTTGSKSKYSTKKMDQCSTPVRKSIEKKPFVILQNMNINRYTNSDLIIKDGKLNSKQYDVEALELFFSKKLDKLVNDKITKPKTDHNLEDHLLKSPSSKKLKVDVVDNYNMKSVIDTETNNTDLVVYNNKPNNETHENNKFKHCSLHVLTEGANNTTVVSNSILNSEVSNVINLKSVAYRSNAVDKCVNGSKNLVGKMENILISTNKNELHLINENNTSNCIKSLGSSSSVFAPTYGNKSITSSGLKDNQCNIEFKDISECDMLKTSIMKTNKVHKKSLTDLEDTLEIVPKAKKRLFDNITLQSCAENASVIVKSTISNDTKIKEPNQTAINALFEPYLKKNDDYDDFITKPTQIIPINQNEKQEFSGNNNIFIKSSTVGSDTANPNGGTLKNVIKQKIQLLNNYINNYTYKKDDYQYLHCIQRIKAIVKEIEQTLITDECKKDYYQKLDSVLVTETTPSVSPEKNCNNIGIQTEKCDSASGFRISPTNMFNTQYAKNNEMQTDTLECPKCKYIFFQDLKKMPTESPSVVEKYILSGSLDNIDFDTQDILKGKHINTSKSLDRFKSSNKNQPSSENLNINKDYLLIENRTQLSPISDDIINQTCKTVKSKKSFKRIRKPSSDTDSDDELLHKNTKKNKFIRNDFSLYFASELQKEINPNTAIPDETEEILLSDEADVNNYGEYLENVLRKCDAEFMCKNSPLKKSTVEHQSKRSKTQEMIKECEMIIKEACSEKILLENTESYNSIHSSTRKISETLQSKNVDHSNNTTNFKNTDISHSLSKKIISNEAKDDLKTMDPTTITNQSKKNKYKETLCDSSHLIKTVTKNNLDSSHSPQDLELVMKNGTAIVVTEHLDISKVNEQPNLIVLEDELANEFNNSFDCSVSNEVESIKNNCPNIVIENNSTMINRESAVLQENEKIKPNEDLISEDDDIFLSDVYVVETTPQKKNPVSLEEITTRSQVYLNEKSKIIMLPIVVESLDLVSSNDSSLTSCLNQVFLPPPDFQDSLQNNTRKNDIFQEYTHNKNGTSLSPDLLLLQENNGHHPIDANDDVLTSTPYNKDSQIIAGRSINISPISSKQLKKVGNPIMAAQYSKVSPLTICKNGSSVEPLSYTLKQQNILSYIHVNEQLEDRNNSRSDKTSWTLQNSINELASPLNVKKPCIACTRMSTNQVLAITSLANMNLITYATVFNSEVTHMIVDVNENNCIKDHTMKFVLAVAAGIWVINFNWIKECLNQKQLLLEDEFEALDVSGIAGPKKSRLNKTGKGLLDGYIIHAAPPFISTSQEDVDNVISYLGGEIASRPDDLLFKDSKIRLIITEAKGTQDFDLYETWLETLKVVTVDLEWLSRSVGQYNKLTLLPFTLCSEDAIGELGYPAELLVEMPIILTHSVSD